MNNRTTKVTQSQLGISIASANPTEYPVNYADDTWDLVQNNTDLKEVMGQEGSATQHEINEKLAEKAKDAITQETDPIFSASPAAEISQNDINSWNAKQSAIADLADIREGAALGATAYQKPSGGIPETDLASAVQISLGKADTALQSHQDISGKADVAALAGYTPTANFATINGASITGGGNVVITAGSSSITTIDAVPTKNSTNPVQSGGVYDAIEGGFYY